MLQKVDHFIPMSKPEISDNSIEEVVKVLKSGWLATGPMTKQFESDLDSYFMNDRRAMTFNSATAGLHAALIAIGIKKGDEVITTPLTFAATANVIAMLGAKPVFVDVDVNTFNIDPQKIAAACNSNTKAIMPVHYAGIPVDLDPIYETAKERNLRVIEDAAHAMGSSYKGKTIGSFGDIQVFSFHPIKNMTTGEGGCVVLNNDYNDEQKMIELQRFHGIDRSIWDRFSKNSSSYYDVVFPGFKSNLSDIQAAIGVHQLKELECMNSKRRKIMDFYKSNLSDMEDVLRTQSDPDYDFVHSGHLFPILILDEIKRDDFMNYLKEYSIGSTPYYTPLHLFTYYRETFGYKVGDFPNAEYIGKRVVCVPLYSAMTDADAEYVVNTIKGFFKN